ncbi:MAG: CDP-diacylglycerol--serine O-phosphatidyltransferase [Candidatus Methanoperedens sp.]|nr:CDP-diacylglycerol--serine O-phosphatidyltransferase [Candidatus Methanoperedens sp.]
MGQNILKLIKPADIITLFNALFGFASILMTLNGQIESALVLIFLAVIADGADGAVARYSGTGVLGANLDSLSDVISFGVAPAVVAFVTLDNNYSLIVFPGLFMVCGILRLARFNVSGKKDGFEGIPITAGGFIVALFIFVKDIVPYYGIIFPALLFILSILMVSTINYPKIKNPIVLAPMAIVLLFDIILYYFNYSGLLKKGILLLLLLIMAYVLSPIWRKNDTDQ